MEEPDIYRQLTTIKYVGDASTHSRHTQRVQSDEVDETMEEPDIYRQLTTIKYVGDASTHSRHTQRIQSDEVDETMEEPDIYRQLTTIKYVGDASTHSRHTQRIQSDEVDEHYPKDVKTKNCTPIDQELMKYTTEMIKMTIFSVKQILHKICYDLLSRVNWLILYELSFISRTK